MPLRAARDRVHDVLLEIIFQGKILGDEHRLPVLFDHVKVIGGVNTALKQNSANHCSSVSFGKSAFVELLRCLRVGSELEELGYQGCRALEGDSLASGGLLSLSSGSHWESGTTVGGGSE